MALETIRAKTAVVSIEIDSVEYNTVFDTMRVRSEAPEQNETVFSTENDGGESSLGTERLWIGVSGPQKKGDPAATPFLPVGAFQDLTGEFMFDTNCGITGTVSARPTDALSSNAGGIRRNDALFVTQGAFVVMWDGVSIS